MKQHLATKYSLSIEGSGGSRWTSRTGDGLARFKAEGYVAGVSWEPARWNRLAIVS